MIDMVKRGFRTGLLMTAPRLLFKLQHYKLHRRFGRHAYWANLKKPRTFNEHILASKLDGRLREIGKQVVDKADVKAYVQACLGEQHLIPTLGLFEHVDDLFDADLPRPCVIKPTHLSGRVIFLMQDSDRLQPGDRETISRWLKTNHYYRTGEPQYRDLRPRIIVEPYIGSPDSPPNDYKIFCWNGEPRFIQVDTSRFSGHRRCFYDTTWKPLDFTLRYPACTTGVDRPEQLGQMLDAARRLSSEFAFVRVDLYEYEPSFLFGELTFHPDSGNAPFSSYEIDLQLGSYFDRE